MILSPEIVKQTLLENECVIEFKKKDGTVRTMRCTLKPDMVVSYEKKSDKIRSVSEEVCPVFDLEKNEWRSFRYDTVTSLTV